MGYTGIMFNNNKGTKVMKEKTITIPRTFGGEVKVTLKEFKNV